MAEVLYYTLGWVGWKRLEPAVPRAAPVSPCRGHPCSLPSPPPPQCLGTCTRFKQLGKKLQHLNTKVKGQMERRLKGGEASVELTWLKEAVAGCTVRHLSSAGHQPSRAVARAMERLSNVEAWPTTKNTLQAE